MADWTNLPNTAVGVGGLPSGTTVTALRDNPVAIAEGAAGAPRLFGIAAATQLEYVTRFPFTNLSGGSISLPSFVFSGDFFAVSTTSGSFQTCGEVTVTSLATGTIRWRAVASSTGTGAGQYRVLKNGVVVAGPSNIINGTINVDIAVVAGDVIEWQWRRESGSSTNTLSGFAQLADDGLTSRSLVIKISEA
jgi:hypothetical protein